VRLTLADAASSRIPDVLGLCSGDYPRLASYINQGTQELMLVASETGWADGWDKILIDVPCSENYLTLPPQYSRMINFAVCRRPLPIFNNWYEVLEAGIGVQGPIQGRFGCGLQAAFERSNVPTAVDLPATNSLLRVYITDARDVNKRILFLEAKDAAGNGIYSTDIGNQIMGFPLVFAQPFTTSEFIVTSFAAIQKDVTYGDVILKAVDNDTGDETFLARYTPQQTNPVYRRYYLQAGCHWPEIAPSGLNCGTRRVTAFAKLEFRPVSQPTDLLLISNLPALKAKVEAIRFSEMDNPTALQMAAAKHAAAVRILNHELSTYHGEKPSVNLAVFGTAKLERVNIGMI
jgi:hypothetical protein